MGSTQHVSNYDGIGDLHFESTTVVIGSLMIRERIYWFGLSVLSSKLKAIPPILVVVISVKKRIRHIFRAIVPFISAAVSGLIKCLVHSCTGQRSQRNWRISST